MPAAEDGSIRRLNKEVIFYTDPRSGQMIDQWTNPYTEEVVDVVHVANDPFNYTISVAYTGPEDFKNGEKSRAEKDPTYFPMEEIW